MNKFIIAAIVAANTASATESFGYGGIPSKHDIGYGFGSGPSRTYGPSWDIGNRIEGLDYTANGTCHDGFECSKHGLFNQSYDYGGDGLKGFDAGKRVEGRKQLEINIHKGYGGPSYNDVELGYDDYSYEIPKIERGSYQDFGDIRGIKGLNDGYKENNDFADLGPVRGQKGLPNLVTEFGGLDGLNGIDGQNQHGISQHKRGPYGYDVKPTKDRARSKYSGYGRKESDSYGSPTYGGYEDTYESPRGYGRQKETYSVYTDEVDDPKDRYQRRSYNPYERQSSYYEPSQPSYPSYEPDEPVYERESYGYGERSYGGYERPKSNYREQAYSSDRYGSSRGYGRSRSYERPSYSGRSYDRKW